MYFRKRTLVLPYIVYKHNEGEFYPLNESINRLKMVYYSEIEISKTIARKITRKIAFQLRDELWRTYRKVLDNKKFEETFHETKKYIKHVEIFVKVDHEKNLVPLLKEPNFHFVYKGEKIKVSVGSLTFFDYPAILIGGYHRYEDGVKDEFAILSHRNRCECSSVRL